LPNFLSDPRFVHIFASLIFHIHILTVAPFVHCKSLTYILGGGLLVAVPSTSALFFFRVRAVYYNNKIVTVFFGSLWFVSFGLCFLLPFAGKAEHIGPTRFCMITQVNHYPSFPLIAHFSFDTLVFLAISLRIASFSIVGDTFGSWMRSFFRGDGLPNLSRSLLYGGQLYYLSVTYFASNRHTLMCSSSTAIGFNLLLLVMMLAPVSAVYHAMFIMPHIAVDSVMACRVFRGIKLGYIKDASNTSPLTTIFFTPRDHSAAISVGMSHHEIHNVQPSDQSFVIEMTKTTQSKII
jgi:hypothetical protein